NNEEVKCFNKKKLNNINWKLVESNSNDGHMIPYYFYESSKKSSPTLVYIHGGPEAQERPEYNELFETLNQKYDYNIILPNIRGSVGYGRTFLFSDLHEN